MKAHCLRFAIAALIVGTPGCASVSYYTQSVNGELNVIKARRPIDRVITDPRTYPRLKQQLELAFQIRNFASRELALPDNLSFRSYADLKRPYALWNVFATPEFSLAPRQWCFPFAGCVDYRGYFSRDDALFFGDRLGRNGDDVYVAGVPTYSTLGWFDDPLLNTFIQYPETELARIIFHELAHQVVYVKGDTTFNESFAVAVELEGVKRWLAYRNDPKLNIEFEQSQQRQIQFQDLIITYQKRLDRLYHQRLAPTVMRKLKAQLFTKLQQDYETLKRGWGDFDGYDGFFVEINNAHLAAISIYTERVPQFQTLIEKYRGNLAAFYAAVKKMAAVSPQMRDAELREEAR